MNKFPSSLLLVVKWENKQIEIQIVSFTWWWRGLVMESSWLVQIGMKCYSLPLYVSFLKLFSFEIQKPKDEWQAFCESFNQDEDTLLYNWWRKWIGGGRVRDGDGRERKRNGKGRSKEQQFPFHPLDPRHMIALSHHHLPGCSPMFHPIVVNFTLFVWFFSNSFSGFLIQ